MSEGSIGLNGKSLKIYVLLKAFFCAKRKASISSIVYGSSLEVIEVMKSSYSSGRQSKMVSMWSSDKIVAPVTSRESMS